MKIHNIRLGLAMNSSSTHSLIFLDELVNDRDVDEREFGWNFFTVASQEAKKDYVALTVYHNLARIYPHDIAYAIAKELFGYDLEKDKYGVAGYVDHQSEIALPRSWDEKTLNKEFIEDFQKYILQDNLVILGGNDNEDTEHPLLAKGIDAGLNMPLEGNRGLVARKDESGYWTLFNRNTGAKIRFSFEKDAKTPIKADAPELVDVKITDWCPFNCSYCYMDSTLRGKHAPMQELDKVIGQLTNMKVFEVALGGGEPTLHPEFMEILRKFDTANIVVNFTTKSLAWLKDPKQWTLIRKYAGGFAYSVEKASEIEECAALLTTNGLIQNVEPYYYREIPFQASVQHVVGVSYKSDFEFILEKAYQYRHNIRLTLLGFKVDGRGHTVKPQISGDEALEIVKKFAKKHSYFKIGIDTALAQQWEPHLKEAGVHETLYHTQEGKFSMYVDAVEGKCAPASYGDMSKATTYAANYNIWGPNTPTVKVDRQGSTLQEAFKTF